MTDAEPTQAIRGQQGARTRRAAGVTQQAKLVATHVPRDPVGAVLLLHGGASRRAGMLVSPTQLSVLRMTPIASRVEHLGGDRLAVYRLLNSTRGWNRSHTPVDDATWA
ncbi:MAG: hypothetical protein ACR2KJ_00575, partial [Jatrophihabitans sp.]